MKNFKFTIKGHNYEVDVKSLEGSIAEIEVNGTLYEVEIHAEKRASKTPTLVRKEIPRAKDAHKIKKNAAVQMIKAPLPGTIMHVKVKEGDEVKRGTTLLVYEAMKMENKLLAEKGGVVRSVKVMVGDSILQGDVLLEIE
ncbi:MAG: biotin/lipoyl-containing protein [Bacteroidota bacterium]